MQIKLVKRLDINIVHIYDNHSNLLLTKGLSTAEAEDLKNNLYRIGFQESKEGNDLYFFEKSYLKI